MTPEEFSYFRENFNKKCEEALNAKGMAYTRGGDDRLINFKRCAEDINIPAIDVWAIYFHKHIDAILYYIRTGKEGPEGIEENFKDARNYLDLGLALIEEGRKKGEGNG